MLTLAGAFICSALVLSGPVVRQGSLCSGFSLSFANLRLKRLPTFGKLSHIYRSFLGARKALYPKNIPKMFFASSGTNFLRNWIGDFQVAGGCSKGFISLPPACYPSNRAHLAFVATCSHLGAVVHRLEPSQSGIWWGQWRGGVKRGHLHTGRIPPAY